MAKIYHLYYVSMTSRQVLIKRMIRIVVEPAMNCSSVHFLFSAICSNVMYSTIRDSHAMTYIGHRMSCHEKAMIATKSKLILHQLYMYAVRLSVPFGQRPTTLAHQPCRLIISCNIGSKQRWSLRLNEKRIIQNHTQVNGQIR